MRSTLRLFSLYFIFLLLIGCKISNEQTSIKSNGCSIVILGIAQDAGYPQANCQKSCCIKVWSDLSKRKMVCSIALFDHIQNQYWIIDATPDFKDQLRLIQKYTKNSLLPEAILLTHAHIGHYTGLMELGRETIGSQNVKVFAMPRMKTYLENNGPWSQLVELQNINLVTLENEKEIHLSDQLSITPILVPHRDEFSETVGYEITGPSKRVLFIPDINKWELWEKDILSYISKVDLVFLDGSFYQNGEIPGRDMSEIPHPFIVESMALFDELNTEDRAKIHFIHFNHTNPVLNDRSEAYQEVISRGYHIAEEQEVIGI